MSRFVVTAGSLLLFAIQVETAADLKVEMLPPTKEAPSVLPLPKEAPNDLPALQAGRSTDGPARATDSGIFSSRSLHAPLGFALAYCWIKRRYLEAAASAIIAPQPYYLYNGMPYRFLPTNPQVWSKNFYP